jgi:hypothetical protein
VTARNIFADALKASADGTNFARYHVEIQCIDLLVGGIPKDPDTITKWLESRLEMGDAALIELANETIAMMVEATGNEPKTEEILDALAAKVGTGNGFKNLDGGLVFEGRCLKAMLKEAANTAYPGVDYPGKPAGLKKGLMRTLAERVFVEELYVPLGVNKPSRTEQRIKHIMTPQGPRSAINVVDVIDKPRLAFTVRVLDDFIVPEAWGRIWEEAEYIGVGADRARSDGRFELEVWEQIEGPQHKKAKVAAKAAV